MKFKSIHILIFVFVSISFPSFAQNSLPHTVLSIGNLADIENKKEWAQHLIKLAEGSNKHTLILNGDLIKKKANDENLREIKTILALLNNEFNGKIIIIPGDRDWEDSGKNGWKNIKKFEDAVNSWEFKNVSWPIDDGCPGPEAIELASDLLLITINTQWWNHPHRKPTPADADCGIISMTAYLEELEEDIEENPNKNIILAAHYPLTSNGVYGGKIPLKEWLLPVPIAAGMISSYRQNVGRPVDLANQRFASFSHTMKNVMRNYESLIYMGGHEKNIQVIKSQGNVMINSGAANDTSPVMIKSYFESNSPGIVGVEYLKNGGVESHIYNYSNDKGYTKNKSLALIKSPCKKSEGKYENARFIPCETNEKVLNNLKSQHAKDTVTIAGEEYKATSIQRFFLGQHYRSSWTTPVKVPYLNTDTTFSGLKPYAKGGGRQTSSLKINAGNGMEYVFRSVNKDPIKALPYDLRNSIVVDVARDQTTTQQPYGAMAASRLLDKLPILHARPTLYVLPNDEMLGPFQEEYGSMLGMLEEKPNDPDSDTDSTFANADDVKNTLKLFRTLYEDNDNHIQKDEFVIARVFDILVGDWGKHEDNWKWAGYDQEKGRLYRPIPRDRDHVFSRWDGLFPWIADREWAKSSGENFGYSIKGLRSLMWQARHLDRALANEANRADWQNAAELIQKNIDDSVIEEAVKRMPKEIYATDGKEIEAKLKARIKDLKQYADEYYRMLAKQVDIIGSEKDERFEIVRNTDGTVQVNVFKIKDGKKGKQLYERKFLPAETKEIRLFGLDDSDEFIISGSTKKSILVRVIPGPSKDKITDNSHVSGPKKYTVIYDKDNDDISEGKEIKLATIKNPKAYLYDRTSFVYNTYFPLAYIGYSIDNGVGLNLGVSFTNHNYNKPDFSSKHDISGSYTTMGNLQLKYDGTWRYIFGKWDGHLGFFMGKPVDFNYFFGIGNDSQNNIAELNDDFYEVRFDSYRLNVGLVRTFLNKSKFTYDIGYEANSEQLRNDNVFDLLPENISGAEKELEILTNDISLDLDFRDRANLPKKGMRLFMNYMNGQILAESKNYGIAQATLEQYISNYWENPLVLGLKAGGSTSHGNVPYYHLKYLGQNNDLRGFRRHRFTGQSTLFSNAELRIQLFKTNTKIVPVKVGLKSFVDVGRVYDNQDISEDWHLGYGAGLYLVPLREQFSINVSAAFSEEESGLILVSIGKTFN